MDFSRHLTDLFSGHKRARTLPTLLITLLVTALVVVPLTVRAVDARSTDDSDGVGAVAANEIVVDMADADRQPLDAQTVRGNVLISLKNDAATGVAFNLFRQGSDAPVLASVDTNGPQFDLVPTEDGKALPFDTTRLPNGSYELFVSISSPDGEQRTAVLFEVSNR